MTDAKKTKPRTEGRKSNKNNDAIIEMIASKAYEIYEQGGREDGKDFEHWLMAERVVMAEIRKAK